MSGSDVTPTGALVSCGRESVDVTPPGVLASSLRTSRRRGVLAQVGHRTGKWMTRGADSKVSGTSVANPGRESSTPNTCPLGHTMSRESLHRTGTVIAVADRRVAHVSTHLAARPRSCRSRAEGARPHGTRAERTSRRGPALGARAARAQGARVARGSTARSAQRPPRASRIGTSLASVAGARTGYRRATVARCRPHREAHRARFGYRRAARLSSRRDSLGRALVVTGPSGATRAARGVALPRGP